MADQRDLGIRADVHDETGRGGHPEISCGLQRGHVIGADEAADIRGHVDRGTRADVQTQLARADICGIAESRYERRATELTHRQAKQQVLHGRIPTDGEVHDIGRPAADRVTQIVAQCIDRRACRMLEFFDPIAATYRVSDPAYEVRPPGHLRVFDAEARKPFAGLELDQKAGDIGRAEIDRQTQAAPAGRRDSNDRGSTPINARGPRIVSQHLRQLARREYVDGFERTAKDALHTFKVTDVVMECCLRNRDVVGCDYGVGVHVPGNIVCLHVGTHDRRQRALRDLDRAIASRPNATGTSPFPGVARVIAAARKGSVRITLPDAASQDMDRAGATGSTSAASPDNSKAVPARRLKDGLVLAAGDFAIELRKSQHVGRRDSSRLRHHPPPPACAAKADWRAWCRHFARERQSSQRDQRARGRSRPTPKTTEADFRGSRESVPVRLTPISAGAGQPQDRRLRFERETRVSGAQFARHVETAPCNVRENPVLEATRRLHEHLVAERIESQRERDTTLREQGAHPAFDAVPERADTEGERRQLARRRQHAGCMKRFPARVQHIRRRGVERYDRKIRPGAAEIFGTGNINCRRAKSCVNRRRIARAGSLDTLQNLERAGAVRHFDCSPCIFAGGSEHGADVCDRRFIRQTECGIEDQAPSPVVDIVDESFYRSIDVDRGSGRKQRWR